MVPVRVGLLGCGRIVRLVHLDVLSRLTGARLVALAETDDQRRAEAAAAAPRGTKVVPGYEEVIGLPEVEALVVCLPNPLHVPAALAALRSGKHVYLEKPLANTTAEAAPLVSAWRESGLVGMMGFNFRFHPLYRAAGAAIAAGRIGVPVAARSVFSTPARALPAWQQERKTGGGVLLNLASHHFDLMRFLLPTAVREVSASLRSQRSEHDTAAVQVTLADGMPIQSLFSMNAVAEDRFEVYGDAGLVALDRLRGSGTIETFSSAGRTSSAERLGAGLRWRLARRREPSYRPALECFVTAVRSGSMPRPDFSDGYRSLAMVEAAEASAARGAAVALPEWD